VCVCVCVCVCDMILFGFVDTFDEAELNIGWETCFLLEHFVGTPTFTRLSGTGVKGGLPSRVQ